MSTTYVDANVLIYAFGDAAHPRRMAARLALERAALDGDLVTSALTIDEFVWARRRESGIDIALEDGRRLLTAPVLQILAVERVHLKAALDNIERFRLRPRDAVHVAVAQAARCARLLSDDPDLDGVTDLPRISP